jgi:hypothetical protein
MDRFVFCERKLVDKLLISGRNLCWCAKRYYQKKGVVRRCAGGPFTLPFCAVDFYLVLMKNIFSRGTATVTRHPLAGPDTLSLNEVETIPPNHS